MDLMQRFKDSYKSSRIAGSKTIMEKSKKLLQEKRKNNRDNLIMGRRNINISTITTPKQNSTDAKKLMLEKLQNWKEQKKKMQLELKAKAKPIFKFQHISIPIGIPNLENVNKIIKGKVFNNKDKKKKSETNKATTKSSNCKSGPTPGLSKQPTTAFGFHIITSTNNQNLPSPSGGIATRLRSQTKLGANVNKRSEKKEKHQPPEQHNKTGLPTPPTTPSKEKLASSYISPYVTISRGKSNARKEFRLRTSQGGLFDVSQQMAMATGPQAGAAYFHKVLNDEITRIERLCEKWLEIKNGDDLPEEACDMINMAVGQSNLLLNKKFKQFRSLIEDCENNSSERPITCTDLHGYWETACLQVENVDKRFEYLENLRKNNWIEILPQTVPEQPQKKKKVVKKPKQAKPESSLRELIKARRQKFKVERAVTEEEPLISFTSRTKTPELLSKSFTHLQRSRDRRIGDGTSTETTPGRGILKTPHSKSTRKKSVLFKTEEKRLIVQLLDNIAPLKTDNSCDSPVTSTIKSSRRSSRRVSTRLMFNE